MLLLMSHILIHHQYHPSPYLNLKKKKKMHPETNPHFLPLQRQTRPFDTPSHNRPQPISPINSQPQPQPPRRGHHQIQRPHPPPAVPQTKPPQSHVTFAPLPSQPGQSHSDPVPAPHPAASPGGLILKRPRKTNPIIWFLGAFCALFWILVILVGLVVLILYFLFRPRSPKFDISNASLNSAYLDMNYLLNADVTLLANFTNPSKKATVDFHEVVMYLYYKETLIASSYVQPLSMKTESKLRTVHLLSSQVMLSMRDREQMRLQIANNRIRFKVEGMFRVRSKLGSIFGYSYLLHGRCLIDVTNAPSGVLIAKKCITKR